mmetsp:Transcript_14099/g.58898  ORF Transcript_14099/g.58898 Transcript_14099/m.58898 type:complete len:252 (+) Transcript_14099:1440-2195(+)
MPLALASLHSTAPPLASLGTPSRSACVSPPPNFLSMAKSISSVGSSCISSTCLIQRCCDSACRRLTATMQSSLTFPVAKVPGAATMACNLARSLSGWISAPSPSYRRCWCASPSFTSTRRRGQSFRRVGVHSSRTAASSSRSAPCGRPSTTSTRDSPSMSWKPVTTSKVRSARCASLNWYVTSVLSTWFAEPCRPSAATLCERAAVNRAISISVSSYAMIATSRTKGRSTSGRFNGAASRSRMRSSVCACM